MKVLLVEESDSDAELIASGLEDHGIAVTRVRTAEQLEANIGGDFDLVLLNLDLSDSTSTETIESVRRMGAAMTIICTESRGHDLARAAGFHGADGIVRKSLMTNGHAESVLRDAAYFARGVKARKVERKRVLRERYEKSRE